MADQSPRVAAAGDAREGVGRTYVRRFFLSNGFGELAGFSAPPAAGAGVGNTWPNS